jgi:GST-like protein
MIDLYTWTTPNGRKVAIMLEELGVPYTAHPIDISKGDQFEPGFLKIAPNNRIPAIVDNETGMQLMESGAIMLYLAEKYGKFMPAGDERWRTIEWLMWQMGGVGPMFGQFNHFNSHATEKLPYAITRYGNEVHRLYRVLNTQLEGREYVAGPYSIADMALFAWTRNWASRNIDAESEFPNFAAWSNRVAERPAVVKGMAVRRDGHRPGIRTEEERKILFNQR